MSKANLLLGRRGESQAVAFLRKQGYRIIAQNYRCKLGEIDIIARDKDTLCFIEVKTRSTDAFGAPAEALLGRKQGQISKAALHYLKDYHLLGEKARFDVISVLHSNTSTTLNIMKNAFELESPYSY